MISLHYYPVRVLDVDKHVHLVRLDDVLEVFEASHYMNRAVKLLLKGNSVITVLGTLDEFLQAVKAAGHDVEIAFEFGFPREEESASDEDGEAENVEESAADEAKDDEKSAAVNALKRTIAAADEEFGGIESFFENLGASSKVNGEGIDFVTGGDAPSVTVNGLTMPIEELGLEDLRGLNHELDVARRWDVLRYHVEEVMDESVCLDAFNELFGKETAWGPVYLNEEENIDKFGLTAGALMKSMVNGKYKKDDKYIHVENGELISTNDFDKLWPDSLASALFEHEDVARKFVSEKLCDRAFGKLTTIKRVWMAVKDNGYFIDRIMYGFDFGPYVSSADGFDCVGGKPRITLGGKTVLFLDELPADKLAKIEADLLGLMRGAALDDYIVQKMPFDDYMHAVNDAADYYYDSVHVNNEGNLEQMLADLQKCFPSEKWVNDLSLYDPAQDYISFWPYTGIVSFNRGDWDSLSQNGERNSELWEYLRDNKEACKKLLDDETYNVLYVY